jgi:hypothetical protein
VLSQDVGPNRSANAGKAAIPKREMKGKMYFSEETLFPLRVMKLRAVPSAGQASWKAPAPKSTMKGYKVWVPCVYCWSLTHADANAVWKEA